MMGASRHDQTATAACRAAATARREEAQPHVAIVAVARICPGMKKRAREWGRCKGKSKGRRRMAVRSRTARGEIVEPRKQHRQRRGQIE
jgi:hypothetical protein